LKKLITATALLLASSGAFATPITYSEIASFGIDGSEFNSAVSTSFTEQLTINAFNMSLGTLTGVSVSVESSMTSAGSITYSGSATADSDHSVFLMSDWLVSTAAADNYTFGTQNSTFLSGSKFLNAGDTDSFNETTGKLGANLTNVNLAAFTNNVTFDFSMSAQTMASVTAHSGSNLGSVGTDTASWGQVTVAYTYNAVAAVPEPTSIAILALGLVGFAASRKKSA